MDSDKNSSLFFKETIEIKERPSFVMSEIRHDFDSVNNQGLILQLFELGKLFVDKKMVILRAQGICMYPCIQQGDILHLETKNLKEIAIGDIVVYRCSNRLFSHRAIDKVNEYGIDYLLTRPDNTSSAQHDSVVDKDILGIVVKIERNGKFVSLEKKTYPLLQACLYNMEYRWYGFKQCGLAKAINVVCFLQQLKFYPPIAKILFFSYYKKLNFSLQVPVNNALDCRLYRTIKPNDFLALRADIENGKTTQARVFATINKRNIACLDLIFKIGAKSSLESQASAISTKVRYRHSGIEEKLTNYTAKLLKEICRAS